MGSIIDLIIDQLVKVSGPDRQGWYTALCPFHNDLHKPNLRFCEPGFRCMNCGQKGTLITLAKKLDIKIESFESNSLSVSEIAIAKGIPEEFLRKLGVTDGYVGSGKHRSICVDIPYIYLDGEVRAIQKRLSMHGQPRFIWRRGDHPIPYGLWLIKGFRAKGYIILVEGASDTWTLLFNEFPALGIPGASNWRKEYAGKSGLKWKKLKIL